MAITAVPHILSDGRLRQATANPASQLMPITDEAHRAPGFAVATVTSVVSLELIFCEAAARRRLRAVDKNFAPADAFGEISKATSDLDERPTPLRPVSLRIDRERIPQ